MAELDMTYYKMEPAQICTKCMICDEVITLSSAQSDLVPRVCDDCKELIKEFGK